MSPRILSALIVSGLLSLACARDSVAAGTVTATIDLTTDQGKPCTVTTTDPQGLHLAQNGTNFTANPATLSGTGCGTESTGPKNPPTTPFVLTPSPNPLSANVGQAFTVSWTITGGTTPIMCAGSFTGAPAGATLTGWTQSVAATIGTNTRSITPTAADVGNGTTAVSFTLAMTCSNADGSITSSALPITINPAAQPDTCPANRLTTATLCYANVNKSCTATGEQNNLTAFPIWLGRYSPTVGTILPAVPPYLDFPGPTGAGPTFFIAPGQYVSAVLAVPTSATVGASGKFSKAFGNITNYTNADFSISSTCGDFDSASIPTACKGTNVPNDGVGIRWTIDTPSTGKCLLTRGQTYYLNVRPNGCTNATCQLRVDG